MATNTTKLGLIKPDLTDIVDVGNLNDNADSIDAAVGFTVCTSATRPATPWSGQSIFETDTLSSFIWDGSTWQTAGGGGSITVSETAPTSPAPGNGDLWYSSTDGRTFVYYEDVDSSQWVEIGQVLGGGGGSSVTVSETAPASPADGDLWWDSGDGEMYLWYDADSVWVDAAGPSVAVQSSAPTGYEGQLWLDDTDGSMYVYYTDPGGGSSSWIGAVSRSGGILQVVSTTKTDAFSTTSTSFVDVTGLSASITPRSTSSKVYVVLSIGMADASTTSITAGDVTRGGTPLSSGTSGTVNNGAWVHIVQQAGRGSSAAWTYLDSPASTSTLTYQARFLTNAGTGYINRNSNNQYGTSSTITLIEVAG